MTRMGSGNGWWRWCGSWHCFWRGLTDAIPHLLSSVWRNRVVVSISQQIYNLLRRYNDSPHTLVANTHCRVRLCNVCWWWRHLYFHSIGPSRLGLYWCTGLLFARWRVWRRDFDRLCRGRRGGWWKPGVANRWRLRDVAGVATVGFVAFQVGILRICLHGNERKVSLTIHKKNAIPIVATHCVILLCPPLLPTAIH